MGEELDHIRKRLKDEGDKTIAFFKALSTQNWDQQIYTTGSGWKVHDLLAHFISAERAYQRYLDVVLRGGIGAPDSLDIDQFNETEVAAMSGTPQELLETYSKTREETLSFTEQLEDGDLVKMANHPWFEGKNVGWYLKLLYRHNIMHRMDIRKSLKRGEPLAHSSEQKTGRQINPQS